jgi:hypothetical protein
VVLFLFQLAPVLAVPYKFSSFYHINIVPTWQAAKKKTQRRKSKKQVPRKYREQGARHKGQDTRRKIQCSKKTRNKAEFRQIEAEL